MFLPVKILSALVGFSLAGSVHARIWTNDRGATVVGQLVAVREADVDLKLKDGRVVAVPRTIFSGADQTYIQEWVQSGGSLPDTDEGAEQAAADGKEGVQYSRLVPNWENAWPARAGVTGFLLVKTVQETDDLSIYESDHFLMESVSRLTEAEQQMLTHRFESILAALATLPLNLTLARKPSRKYLIRLCFSEEELDKVPGLRNARIKFSPTSFTALLLRDRKGKAVKMDGVDPRFAVTHWVMQAMDREHWLVDGLSNYMSVAPVEKDEIVLGRMPAKLAGMVPRSIRNGKKALPALADLLARDSSHVVSGHDSRLREQDHLFWAELLWTVYLCHLEGDGSAGRLKRYLQAWEAEDVEKARSILLNGKSAEDVQQDVSDAWKRYGMKLKFAPPSPASGKVEASPVSDDSLRDRKD